MDIFNTVFYIYNDMAVLFLEAYRIHYGVNLLPLFDTTLKINGVDLLNTLSLIGVFKLFEPILAVNVISIIYLLILAFFSYKLFTSFKVSRIVAVIFTLLNTFSIYTVYRVLSFTPNILQVFFFPLIFILLLKRSIKPFYMGLLLAFFYLTSLYNGYYCTWFVIMWLVAEFVWNLRSGRSFGGEVKHFLKYVGLMLMPLLLLVIVGFWNLAAKTLPFLSGFSGGDETRVISNMPGTYRPLENFYNLTFRPWYFVIPPKNSLFLGDLSKSIFKRIEETNYYLANDYTEEEAAGSYLGWHMIIGLGLVLIIFLINSNDSLKQLFPTIHENRSVITKSLITISLILLISGPPSFTINGTTFYTPTYLMYFIFPIFRTLVRFSAIITMLVFTINLFLINDIYNMCRTSKVQRLVFLVFIVIINIYMFALKIPVVSFSNPPAEYIGVSKLPKSSLLAVYPKGDYKTMFWTLYTKIPLANPVGFVNFENGLSSDEFSKNLLSDSGISKARSLGVSNLLVLKNEKVSLGDAKIIITALGGSVLEENENYLLLSL